MKKKGFTLIELLATIIILALIGLIVYPTLNSVINGNKEKLHNKQIEELVRLTNTYSTQNMDKLKTLDGARNIVSFNDLYKSGLIKSEEIIDPATNEKLNGCMALTWRSSINGFDIKYIEDCNNSFSLSGNVTVTDRYNGSNKRINNANPKVQLLQGDKVMYETIAADDGSYSFNDVEGGTYLILVSKQYRTKYGREIDIVSDTTKDITSLLYVGDFNEDDIIDYVDADIYTNSDCYRGVISSSDSRCDIYDMDGSGGINSSDLTTFNSNVNHISDIIYSETGKLVGKVKYDGGRKPALYFSNSSVNEQVIINNDGSFEMKNLQNGLYRVYLTTNTGYTMYSKKIFIRENGEINLTLYAGDLDDNGIIDEEDQYLLNYAIEKGYDISNSSRFVKYDLNGDGVIDNKDLVILNNNLGKTAS